MNEDPPLFNPLYDSAANGSNRAHQTLISAAIGLLAKRKLPPPRLLQYFLESIQEPDEHATRMKEVVRRKKPGRQSIDDTEIRADVGLLTKYFGEKPTEKNALMIAYLISEGHPINEFAGGDKESAVVLLSELTGRDERSLQRDYYLHKAELTGESSQLKLGKAYFGSKKVLHGLRNPDAEDDPSS